MQRWHCLSSIFRSFLTFPPLAFAISARPDSAPTLHRRYQRDTVLSSRERSPSKQRHASAWLPPRVTRLERETQDLLTACRKAGRDKGDATRWLDNEQSRHGRTAGESPLRGSGESRRRSESSNTDGSWWGKTDCARMLSRWMLMSRYKQGLRTYLPNTVDGDAPWTRLVVPSTRRSIRRGNPSTVVEPGCQGVQNLSLVVVVGAIRKWHTYAGLTCTTLHTGSRLTARKSREQTFIWPCTHVNHGLYYFSTQMRELKTWDEGR